MQAIIASALLLSAGPLAVVAQASAPAPAAMRNSTMLPTNCTTLTDVMELNELNTIYGILIDMDLIGVLDSQKSTTVFLPTDEAFIAAGLTPAKLAALADSNVAALETILGTHIAQGELTSALLSAKPVQVASLNSDKACPGILTATKTAGGVTVETEVVSANVEFADIPVCSGVVHIVDQVLIPCQTIEELLSKNVTTPSPTPTKTATPKPTTVKPTATATPKASVLPIASAVATPAVSIAARSATNTTSAATSSIAQGFAAACAMLAAVFVL